MSEEALIPIVAIAITCGGPLLWGIVHSSVSNWRQVKVAEGQAALKREMVERGYSADEIVRVMEAGGGSARPRAAARCCG